MSQDEHALPSSAVPPALPSRVALLWHTLRHLRPVQWRHRLRAAALTPAYRRAPGLISAAIWHRVPVAPRLREPDRKVNWFRKQHTGHHGMFSPEDVLNGKFRFLHLEKQFGSVPSWKNPEFTYLWDFNLHYFEYLPALTERWHAASGEPQARIGTVLAALLDSWIRSNPCPIKPAWHPYPTSLRVLNWIRALQQCPELGSSSVLRSLYAQVLWLEQNIEGHLMVNHYLENGRSLLAAGLYFDGEDAERWRKRGESMVRGELAEEWLPCGGHFERSPMYHAILIEGLLDTHAQIVATGAAADWLRAPLLRMCDWLAAAQTPDAWYPLFNDTAIGISASPEEIFANAERMIGYRRAARVEPISDCDRLWLLRETDFVCAVDGAPIGPDYNPGHAHADNLSFEAWYRGEKLVVDPGVFTYDTGTARRWLRSSLSHNTVVVNGHDQSETWGGFRVGRRSHAQSWAAQIGGALVFRGTYRNQLAKSEGIQHERIVVLLPSSHLVVWDTVTAAGAIDAESRCQFGPEWSLTSEAAGGFQIEHAKGHRLFCRPFGSRAEAIGEGFYSPEFGLAQRVKCLTFTAQGAKRIEMGFTIGNAAPERAAPIAVERVAEMLTISVGSERYSIDLGELGR